MTRRYNTTRVSLALALVVGLLATVAAVAAPPAGGGDISPSLRQALAEPVREKAKALGEEKNEQGVKNKRGSFSSRGFRKVDDSTYTVTFIKRTAEDTRQVVERHTLTLKPDPAKANKWVIAEETLEDTYDGLRRQLGMRCRPYDSFSFDRYGMKMSTGPGGVCESFYENEVEGLIVIGQAMSHDYTAPVQGDFYTLQQINDIELRTMVNFDPDFTANRFEFVCDTETCEELLASCFSGLAPAAPREGEGLDTGSGIPAELAAHVQKEFDEATKARKDDPFSGFRPPDWAGNRFFIAAALKNDDEGEVLLYDNWGGFEVTYSILIKDPTLGDGAFSLYGYYTDETLATTDPYELELRDDHVPERGAWLAGGVPLTNRWFHVHSLNGEVAAALEDPEMLEADIEFGITAKQQLTVLPFTIASIPQQGAGGGYKPPPLYVNQVQLDGQDLTYVRTGSTSGLVILPEPVPAGTQLNIRMDFATRAIYKVNHAFSAMARFGWMPFVRFGDFIDDFELTIRAPSKYEVLGIGHKTSEKREGDVLISHWKSESPVVFPTIIFGKYQSDTPGDYQAKKLDGTLIPVEVHVDEVSMGQLNIAAAAGGTAIKAGQQVEAASAGARGIRGKQLRPIATQAAVAINLFNELSGIDYPYGELNLVNDPAPALYGQAPSSLIYLGSFVFRGEGTMVSEGGFGFGTSGRADGTDTAAFLKSVVAHEVGHQWWGSRVANQNTRNYWFVETLAEYFSAIYLERVFGPGEYQKQVDQWRRTVLERDAKSSVQNASALFPGTDGGGSYQAAVYNKGPYAFHILRKTFGDEKFFPFLKQFTQELAQKGEIVTRDIQMTAERALGGVDENGNPYNVDLEWFFDQWIRGVGLPEYRFLYDVRQTEDGNWLVEGTVQQRIVIGNQYKKHVVDGQYYRGVVPITVIAGKQEFQSRLLIEGAETPFRLKVPERPLDVILDKNGDILSHAVVVNKSW